MLKRFHLFTLFAILFIAKHMDAQVYGVYAPCPASSYLPSSLYYLEDNGNATLIGPVTLGGNPLIVNGLGYQTGSGKLFAMSSNAQNLYAPVLLYSIESASGTATLKGTVSNPPGAGVTLPLVEYTTALSFVADVDEDGIYRIPGLTFVANVITGQISDVKLYLGSFNPDVTTVPVWQQLNIDAATLAILNNFIVQTQAYLLCGGGPACPKPEGGIQDWVYSNGKLISYYGVEKKLFTLDIATLNVTTTTPSVVLPNVSGSNEMGGIFKDNEGNFYAVQVYTGRIYKFDPVTGNILNPNDPFDLALGCSLGDNASNPVGSSLLPVSLLSFQAIKSGSEAILKWVASSETDLNKYEVQKLDLNNQWQHLGSLKPLSQKKQEAVYNYSITDKKLAEGRNMYRLKMIDNNGVFKYSDIATVNFGKDDLPAIFPNPAKDFIQVSGMDVKTVTITDITGKVILETRSFGGRWDISSLSPGIYFAKLNGSSTSNIKFVKM